MKKRIVIYILSENLVIIGKELKINDNLSMISYPFKIEGTDFEDIENVKLRPWLFNLGKLNGFIIQTANLAILPIEPIEELKIKYNRELEKYQKRKE